MRQFIKTSFLSLLTALVAVAGFAQAQDTEAAVTGVVEAPVATASVLAKPKPAPAAEKSNWELCPEPQQALNDVPASPEKLQADIDRYTLCVSRAELLMQLNDLKNGPDSAVNAMALPGVDAGAPPPLTPEQTSQLLDQPDPLSLDVAGSGGKKAAPPPAPAEDVITVSEVRGVSGELKARVKDQEGNVALLGVGDQLTNGAEITAITATQVTVRKGGKTTMLDWSQ